MSKPISDSSFIQSVEKICNSAKFNQSNSHLKKFKIPSDFKMDFSNQLLRGSLIENVLMLKLLQLNKYKSIYKIEGKYRERGSVISLRTFNRFPPKKKRSTHLSWIQQIFAENYFPSSIPFFKSEEVIFKASRHFKAKDRCLIKPSIDYCFIDIIIDNTLIDIKTDIDTKKLKDYIKQVIVQSVMFSSFLKAKIIYDNSFGLWEHKMITAPIDTVAIYFWRTNEFFKYPISDILSNTMFDKLVSIYSNLSGSQRTQMRNIMKRHLFTNLSRPI